MRADETRPVVARVARATGVAGGRGDGDVGAAVTVVLGVHIDDLFTSPSHTYTRELLASVPIVPR